MNFGQPIVGIGQKMANGQLLFVALKLYAHACTLPEWPYPSTL